MMVLRMVNNWLYCSLDRNCNSGRASSVLGSPEEDGRMTTGRPVSTHDALGSATRRHLIELLSRCGAADADALAGELACR